MSGDAEQDYFVDGMVEDIITGLSRIKWLFVIARNSSFVYKGKAVDIRQVGRELGVRYVLEGSVRKGGNRLRITAQLIEAETGAHLWADRFDGALDDVFELQDQMTERVVGVIEPSVRRSEIERSRRKRPKTSTPTTSICALCRTWQSAMPADAKVAIGFLEEALELDPDYAGGARRSRLVPRDCASPAAGSTRRTRPPALCARARVIASDTDDLDGACRRGVCHRRIWLTNMNGIARNQCALFLQSVMCDGAVLWRVDTCRPRKFRRGDRLRPARASLEPIRSPILCRSNRAWPRGYPRSAIRRSGVELRQSRASQSRLQLCICRPCRGAGLGRARRGSQARREAVAGTRAGLSSGRGPTIWSARRARRQVLGRRAPCRVAGIVRRRKIISGRRRP